MSFSAATFKSNLAKAGGGARPALYKVKINYGSATGAGGSYSLSAAETLLVKAAALPASNIAPLTVNYAGRAYKWQGFRTYDIWTVTVLNDEDFSIRQKMMEWMRKLSGKMDGDRTVGFGDPAKSQSGGTWKDGEAIVTQMGTDGVDKQNYKFYNLWPTELAEIPVDWSSDMLEEYTIGFAYDYWSEGTGTGSNTTVSGAWTPSDYRFKNNIVLLQKATSILPNIYMFKYKWDKFTNYIGVMAQELLDTRYSSAVHKDSNGFYSVDYSKFGLPFGKISNI